ncbi:hypothetical protein M758_1G277400 [Ceratodon purpureus]|nr:hypothetical protein M758_1G277400 [Ceratodon purpureus]
MGKMKKVEGMPGAAGSVPLPAALTDFRQESYWDQFFKASQGRPFEWYGDWVSLPRVFRELLGLSADRKPPLEILVPGCGNSRLSAAMYDAGFQKIVNVDFNKRVVAEMLRLNVRARPLMRWQVMDITKMQFADNSFDVVLDKGSLDALTGEPDEPQIAAEGLLSEVKRVLRHGGKYVCITLAQQHVIELLLGHFRIGWDVVVYQVQDESNDTSAMLQPLLVVATKTDSVEVSPVRSSLEEFNPAAANAEQMKCVVSVIEVENKLRTAFEGGRFGGALEDQTIEEDYSEFDELSPGKVRAVKLGGHYPAVILDAKPDSGSHMFKAAVFLVPRGRAHEWLFSTEEGQWEIVEAAKAGRLIMVMLDTQQYPGSLAAVQDELSHVVKFFLPLDCKESKDIPYMTTDDGVHRRTVIEERNSPITGIIKVEDVVLEYKKSSEDGVSATTQSFYRRLVFDRNPNLIQSDAILLPYSAVVDDAQQRTQKKKKKKGKAKESVQDTKEGAKEEYRVDHSQLASSYHAGMVAGLALISHNLDQSFSTKEPVRVMVVGLGAGLLPMFLHNHLPVDHIEVVELDGVIGDLAKRHFGFVENDRMKLHIGDGIEAVHAIGRTAGVPVSEPSIAELSDNLAASHISGNSKPAKDQMLHVLIIDADAGDSSLEMSCPPQGFLEESFLSAAKAALVDGGVLAVNVVSRAAGAHSSAVAKLQKVFEEVYELKVDEDVNRVLFALPRESPVRNDSLITNLRSATQRLKQLATDFAPWQNGPILEDYLQEGKIRLVPRA